MYFSLVSVKEKLTIKIDNSDKLTFLYLLVKTRNKT